MTAHAGTTPDPGAPEPRFRVHGSLPEPERRGPLGVFISACLHVVLIWLLVGLAAHVADPKLTQELVSFMMPEVPKPGGGGGGGVGGVVPKSTPPPPPPEAVKPVVPPPPPPVAVEVPTTIPPVTPPVETPPASTTVAASSGDLGSSGRGGGTGGGVGTGNGTGTGSGDGPGTGSGRGGGDGNVGREPESKQLAIPEFKNAPKAYKGKPIEVTFHVAANGTVLSVETNPVITDKKFADSFLAVMRSFVFTPGTDSLGKKVPKKSTMTFTIGGL